MDDLQGELDEALDLLDDDELPPVLCEYDTLVEKLRQLISQYKFSWNKREKYINELCDIEHVLNANGCSPHESISERVRLSIENNGDSE